MQMTKDEIIEHSDDNMQIPIQIVRQFCLKWNSHYVRVLYSWDSCVDQCLKNLQS